MAHLQRSGHPIGDARRDLVKQAVARRVQGVIQIEHPSGYMGKGRFYHARMIGGAHMRSKMA
jgi:hypothetical protein